jgi:diguanylate cyclase (GGDEF)-like protein
MALFGIMQLFVAAAAIMQGATGDDAYNAMFATINHVSLPIGYIATAMLAFFMLMSDLSEHMPDIAVRDQLTGLLNRRGFAAQSANAYATARRSQRPVSVIMSDIDRFKNINDELGHAAGDQALCHIARILEQNRRAEDILARLGGEEFAIVLPGCDVAESLSVANKLCRLLESTILDVPGQSVSVTASFGVATISDRDSSLSDVIVRADKALFRSKRAGRNRVELDSSQVILLSKGSLTRDSA